MPRLRAAAARDPPAISLASLAASQALGLWWADAIAALVVGVIVLPEGWSSLNLAATRRFGH